MGGPAARIVAVEPESPADDAGFTPGCYLTTVDGEPLRDIIDWRWLAADDVICVGYIDLDGEAGEVELEREPGERWGFEFDGVLFDSVKLCRNACVFCFMRQLPDGVRPSLVLRDDDFRLSFLVGHLRHAHEPEAGGRGPHHRAAHQPLAGEPARERAGASPPHDRQARRPRP